MRGNRPRFTLTVLVMVGVGIVMGTAWAYPREFTAAIGHFAETVRSHTPFLSGEATPPVPGGADGRHGGDAHRSMGSDRPGRGKGGSHTVADCRAVVTAGDLSGVPAGLRHAIAVVEANCEENPHAGGLLVALRHLVRDAGQHAVSPGRGNSPGHRGSGVHGDAAAHGGGTHGNPEGHGGSRLNGSSAHPGTNGNARRHAS